jgi:putative heme iron utilization protein
MQNWVDCLSGHATVAQLDVVSLDHMAQQYAQLMAGIGADQLWAALRQWGATTLLVSNHRD